MSSRKLFILDPYNENQINLLKEFEEEIATLSVVNNYIKKVTSLMSKEEYKELKKVKNEIEETLIYMEDDKIIDICHLEVERDIKTCKITFTPLLIEPRNRRLVELATNYALNELNLEEVFVKAHKEDGIINRLKKIGYEDLGEENGNTIFLKEKEQGDKTRKIL